MHHLTKVGIAGGVLLLCNLYTASTQKSATPSRTGGYYGGITQTPWFAAPGVRKELGLTDQQLEPFTKAYGQAWSQFHKNALNTDKLDPAERAQQMNKYTQQFNNDFSKSAQGMMKPDQLDRFNQLYLQYRGYGALSDPEIQQKLKLTDEQRQMFGKLNEQYNQSMSELYKGLPDNRDIANNRFGELRNQANEKINSTLTPEQRQQWRQMTGQPYTFDPYWGSSAAVDTKK